MRIALLVCAVIGVVNAESYKRQEKKGYYKARKQCYQCAYSPPQIYYDKKIVLEKKQHGGYAKEGYYDDRRDETVYLDDGYGKDKKSYEGGYAKKSVYPQSYTVEGGWDKCKKAFSEYEAKSFGIDLWDCEGNCYVRKDKNNNIYRGCYKGEFGINHKKLGCHQQGDAYWCFCYGSKCNDFESPR